MPTLRRIPTPDDNSEPVEQQLELPVDLPAKSRRQRRGAEKPRNGNGGSLGFEATLWAAADKLRNNAEADMIDIVNQHLEDIRALCRAYSVVRLEVFGSATRADFDPQ